jgi:MFS family permease
MKTGETRGKLSANRLAVAAVFFVNGATLASWVPHIPTVQSRLNLSDGLLGLALLAFASGALVGLATSGWLIGRFSSRSVTRVATVLLCASLPWPVLAPRLELLVLALALFGAANGAMDVAMNAQGVAVEERHGAPIMSSFHGLFSLGGLAGAGLAGIALTARLSPTAHVLAATLVLGGVGALALGWLLPGEVDRAPDEPKFALPVGPVLGLSILALFSLIGEGAMADWSAVYLRHTLGADAGLAATGFAAFSLTMAIARFSGDRLVGAFGPVRVVRASASFSAGGLGLALIAGQPLAAIVGFGCVGLGLANVIPILFSAAGRLPGVSAGKGIAAVATTGYLGFLAGPPLIGFAADVVTLRGALGLVVLFTALIAAFAHVIKGSVQ